jgi:hypothetical protein
MFNPVSIESWRNLFTRHGSKFAILLVMVFAIPLVLSYNSGCGSGMAGGSRAGAANAAVVRINGEEVSRAQFESAVQRQGVKLGDQFALAQGRAVDALTQQVVIKQEAKKANARATDADIDRQILQIKESVIGKNGKESDWETFLYRQRNITPSELRELVAEEMAGQALLNKYVAAETATEADAKKQHDQVKLQLVLIATELPQGMPLPPGARVYADAEGKRKAEELLAKAKTGDIGAIAKAESADMTRQQSGDTDWRNEFAEMMFGDSGALGYGKAFDEAVHQTAKGQLTPVVPASGFTKGYVFAKVVDRKSNLPKDFDAKKEIETIKQSRAQKKFSKLIQDGVKAAKIEVLDPDKKAYYEFAKFKKMEEHKNMGNSPLAAMMGMGEKPPTQAEVDKQKALAYSELEASLKRNPNDPTLNAMIAQNLEKDIANVPKNRDRIITMYETALANGLEDQEIRFKLAGYYRDKGDKAKAAAAYERILSLINIAPAYDLASMRAELTARQRLGAGLKSVDRTDLVEKSDAEVPKLMQKIAEEEAKQKAAQPPGGMGSAPGSPIQITPTPTPSPASGSTAPKSEAARGTKPPASPAPAPSTSKDAKTP